MFMQIETLAPIISGFGAPIAAAIAWIAIRADRAKDERIARFKAWGEGLELAKKAGDRLLKETAYQIGLNVRKVSMKEIQDICAAYPDDAMRVIKMYDAHTSEVILQDTLFKNRYRTPIAIRAIIRVFGYFVSAYLSLIFGRTALSQFMGGSTDVSLIVVASLFMLLAVTLLLTAIHIWESRKLMRLRPETAPQIAPTCE